MTMPKGYKSKFGYATVSNTGLGFQEIAEQMTKAGDKMNHATARNVLLRALKKLSVPICQLHGVKKESLETEALKTACDPRFQEAICKFLEDELA